MKKYKVNIELSIKLFEEARLLVERNACYINIFRIKDILGELDSVKDLDLKIGYGYWDCHGLGIFGRHCFFVIEGTNEIIDPTFPAYGFDLKSEMTYYCFKTITAEEMDEYNRLTFGNCDYRFSYEEYLFLKPFFGEGRLNYKMLMETLKKYKMLLTVGEEDFFNYVVPMFKAVSPKSLQKEFIIVTRQKRKEALKKELFEKLNLKEIFEKEFVGNDSVRNDYVEKDSLEDLKL